MEADNMNDDARDSSASRGSRDEPIGHQYVDEYGRPSGFLWWREGETRWPKSQTVPLYLALQPTFTDEEREAVERLIEDFETDREPASAGCVATLRGLLERHKGGER
jgi:hypothetical protein